MPSSKSSPEAGVFPLFARAPARLLVFGFLAAINHVGANMTMNITSSAFNHNGSIPRVHTCEGKDISPPLSWSSAPSGTRSLVLIVDDPDAPDPAAPRMTWVHWVLYNLPANSGAEPATAAPALRSAGTATFTSSTRLTSCCPTLTGQRRRSLSRPCKGTSSRKPS